MSRIIGMLCIFLLGCASSYVPSEGINNLKASMTDEGALKIISNSIMRNAVQKGVCRSFHEGNPFPEAEPIKMVGAEIIYESWATTKWEVANTKGDFLRGTGQVTMRRNMKKFIFALDVTQLKEIRILDENKGGYQCSRTQENILVMIKRKIGNQVAIEVQPEKLEPLIAALTHLSPNAKLVHGLGF